MTKVTTLISLFLSFFLIIIVSNRIVVQQTENLIYDNVSEINYKEYTLVLGTSKNGKNGINPYFKYRLDAAVELYKSGKTNKIIVSGDNHIKGYNETEDMSQYLIARGIPSSCIIKDYAGFRTLDSVVRAKKVFNCNSLIIVSQKFHNQRALYIANYYQLDAVALNAQDVSSSKNYTHLREYLAKTLVIFDLYILGTNPKYL